MPPLLQKIIQYTDGSFEGFVDDLYTFIGIPSISGTDKYQAEIEMVVDWLHKRLSKVPFDRLEIFETISNPILYAEINANKLKQPTVLIYGHYDVQPAVAIDDWHTDPFKAERQGDYLYGRGASDMKGQVLAYINAIEAILNSGPFPINIKLLLEGDEENDPEPLAQFLRENSDLLICDFSLNCDAMLIGINEPTIVYGLRGGTECTLEIVGPVTDIHGGLNAGVVENPIHVLSRLLSGLVNGYGQVTLPGFYENVRAMDAEERTELARLPLDDDYYKSFSGAPELTGEVEFLPVERTGARPAVNVSMFKGGSEKGSIPSRAVANISFLLVPDQDPEEIYQQFIEYVKDNTPPTVTWDVKDYVGFSPSLIGRDSHGVNSIHQALETVWGNKPLYLLDGGSIPVVASLHEIMGVESVLIGFSLPDDNIHGPNERVHLPTLKRGIETLIRFFFILADDKYNSLPNLR